MSLLEKEDRGVEKVVSIYGYGVVGRESWLVAPVAPVAPVALHQVTTYGDQYNTSCKARPMVPTLDDYFLSLSCSTCYH